MTAVAPIPYEFQRQHERIAAIAALTVGVAGHTDDAVKQITRHAIAELGAINREIKRANLPPEQQQQLRDQVTAALSQHRELLAIATARSQQLLAEAIATPLPKRSVIKELSDGIDNTVHALTGNIFRRS